MRKILMRKESRQKATSDRQSREGPGLILGHKKTNSQGTRDVINRQ